jgi:hypothetical protein
MQRFLILLLLLLNLTISHAQFSISHESGFYIDSFILKVQQYDLETINIIDGKTKTDIKLGLIPTTIIPNISTSHNQGEKKVQYEKHWKRPKSYPVVFTATYKYKDTTAYRTFFFEKKHSLPILSIHIDSNSWFNHDTGIYQPGVHCNQENSVWTGNYHQKGKDWERPVHAEYFEDYQKVFEQYFGMRIHGLKSGSAPQKSFRIYAREKYGSKYIKHNFFGIDSLKRMIVRTPFSCHGQRLMVDPIIHELAKNTHVDRMSANPVVLYVNGEYWGLHFLRERMDEKYIKNHYGLNKSEIAFGDWKKFGGLVHQVEQLNMKDSIAFAKVEALIDIPSFIDYIVLQTFFRNKDWLVNNNNTIFWQEGKDGKWRFLLIDLDAGFQAADQDMFAFLEKNEKSMVGRLYFQLLKQDAFKTQFFARYQTLLETTLSTNHVINQIDSMTGLVDDEILHQSNRWSLPEDEAAWEKAKLQMKTFATARPQNIIDHIKKHYKIELTLEEERESYALWMVAFGMVAFGIYMINEDNKRRKQ